ncbi:MAG: sensor histidine kinase [Gammaproteobacteria bacterium]|nr:sensor histidine kinase [Gammaproteobacteria bacterium]
MLGLVMLQFAAASWGNDTLVLERGEHYRDVAPYIGFLEDPEGALTLSDIRHRAERHTLQADPGDRVDFGFSKSTYWLRLPLRNGEDTEISRRLSLNIRFMQELDIWIVGDEEPALLLHDHADLPFGEREIRYRHLVSTFELAPRESAVIYIRYASARGHGDSPVHRDRPELFRARRLPQHQERSVLRLHCVHVCLQPDVHGDDARAAVLLLQRLPAVHCAASVPHGRAGVQFLWPDRPGWNAFAALPLGLNLTVGAALFSREFLQSRTKHPIMDKVLLSVLGATIIMMISPLVLDTSLLKQLAFPWTFLATLLFLGCGIVALRRDRIGNRFYVAGWTGLTIAALISTFAHWSPGMVAVGLSFETMRIGVLLDATMMALAIIDRIRGLRRERDNALAHESVMMQEMLDLHDRFLTLENRYAMARNLAEARGLQLATTGHDLRQPLASLRSAMQSLKSGRRDSDLRTTDQLRGTLSYLEQLVDGVMQSATGEAPQQRCDADSGDDSGPEDFPVQLVFDNVQRMFDEDARARGLTIRCVPTSLQVHADPLVVMRMMANLTSNAVKYATGDRIVIGCRRGPADVRLMVVDGGPGIPEAELETLSENYVRGAAARETANGHGLGLGIVAELARRHGYHYSLKSREGHGTAACITLPRAPGM